VLLRQALEASLARLSPRDRLRLACYYAQELTLADVGRLLKEHEATVSRHLAKTRQTVRADVEEYLRVTAGLSADEIRQCVASVADDTGPIDLGQLLATSAGSKNSQ
jgi:DNA-directed RNA polymerase specialized sigma24 family protein